MTFLDLRTIEFRAEDISDCEKQGMMASAAALDVNGVKAILVMPSTVA